jgi:hypothetical protein
MTRPLALIEGALALPTLLSRHNLPPPFGTWRRPVASASRPFAPRGPVPAGVKHVLTYTTKPQKVDSQRIDAALAEARHYIEMDSVLQRSSSRSDHLLSIAIFAGCSIALAWLLVTCSNDNAQKVNTSASVPAVAPIANPSAHAPQAVAKQAIESVSGSRANANPTERPNDSTTLTVARDSPARDNQPRDNKYSEPSFGERTMPSPHASRTASLEHSSPPARPDARPDGRPNTRPAQRAIARVDDPSWKGARINAPAAASIQPEWASSKPSVNSDSAAQTELMNWAAQLHRAMPTVRAATVSDGNASNWNAQMTQRRITDNPDAFVQQHLDQ